MISIIMGTYNGEKYLREQVDSILAQDMKDWRLFIFDDGSKDGTEKIASEYEKEHRGKIFFFKNQENYGAKGNFFQGLSHVLNDAAPESEYFAFSDQDDVWDENKLSLAVAEMQRIKGEKVLPCAVFSDVRLTDESLTVTAPSYFDSAHLRKDKLDFASLLMENKAIGGTMMINHKMAKLHETAKKRAGGQPKRAKMHDWWFALIGAALGEVRFINRPTEKYRQHGENEVGGEGFYSYLKERLTGFSRLRYMLYENLSQGEEFLEFFKQELSFEKKEILDDFIKIKKSGFLKRRRLLQKRGFYKSGFLRNLALFIVI